MVRPSLTDLNPYEFNYYPFNVSLDMCDASCNTAKNPFDRIRERESI